MGNGSKDIFMYLPQSVPDKLQTIIDYMLGYGRRFGAGLLPHQYAQHTARTCPRPEAR